MQIPDMQRLSIAIRLLAAATVVFVSGCATVGVDIEDVQWSPERAFDRALVAYAVGELEKAQALTLRAFEENPLDARATDLMRAILKEKGLVEELEPARNHHLPTFDPATPQELVQLVSGRNAQLREAVFSIIESRARLREANVDVGPELSLLTRFYPPGILARLTQSLYGGVVGTEGADARG